MPFQMARSQQFEMALDRGCDVVIHLVSTPIAVRQALGEIVNHPTIAQLDIAVLGDVQLVLAEVLNNIVEHAFDCDDGKIELRLRSEARRLFCTILDFGAPMPQGLLPTGLPQSVGGDQPPAEGGYGWFLIRAMAKNLLYRRIGSRNHLSFEVKIEQ